MLHPLLNKIRVKRHNASLAMKRRRGRIKKLNQNIEILIVSPGGVATTMLIKHIGRFKKVNCPNDTDELKHMPYPPKWIGDEILVIFIYGDVNSITKSISRRGWISIQGAKLGSLWSVLVPRPMSAFFFRGAVSCQIRTWADWARKNTDRAMVLEYNSIWNNIDKIRVHCRINDWRFAAEFPEKRERISP